MEAGLGRAEPTGREIASRSPGPGGLQFPHRAWDEELLRRQGQEDVIARNISERQRWKTAVLERAKKPDSPGDGPGTAPPGAREPRD